MQTYHINTSFSEKKKKRLPVHIREYTHVENKQTKKSLKEKTQTFNNK